MEIPLYAPLSLNVSDVFANYYVFAASLHKYDAAITFNDTSRGNFPALPDLETQLVGFNLLTVHLITKMFGRDDGALLKAANFKELQKVLGKVFPRIDPDCAVPADDETRYISRATVAYIHALVLHAPYLKREDVRIKGKIERYYDAELADLEKLTDDEFYDELTEHFMNYYKVVLKDPTAGYRDDMTVRAWDGPPAAAAAPDQPSPAPALPVEAPAPAPAPPVEVPEPADADDSAAADAGDDAPPRQRGRGVRRASNTVKSRRQGKEGRSWRWQEMSPAACYVADLLVSLNTFARMQVARDQNAMGFGMQRKAAGQALQGIV